MTDGAARVEVVLAGGDVLGGDVGVGLDAPLRVYRRQPPLRQILRLNRYGARQENSRREGDREASIRHSAKDLDNPTRLPTPDFRRLAQPNPRLREPHPRPPTASPRTTSRIPLAVAAKRTFRRTTKTSALCSPPLAPADPPGQIGRAGALGVRLRHVFGWGYVAPPQGIRKRSSEVPPRRPTAGRSPAPDARLTSPHPRPREPHNV